jgi:DNA-binding MurR/RpiR family transcriptional regulator
MSKIEAELSTLPKQEAKVAQYFLLNLDSLSFETGSSIARKIGVAEITVGRMLRRFGLAGMKEFKLVLRQKYAVVGGTRPSAAELSPIWRDQLSAEMAALQSVYDQLEAPGFQRAIQLLCEVDEVYVTGFQTVRGLAEDTSRRLSLARRRVRFLSAHDGMLSEWINEDEPPSSCLLLIDVVPYAAECQAMAQMAKDQGRAVIMVTDEYCHWAKDVADAVINAPSATGLFLESVLGLSAALALLTHHVAEARPEGAAAGLKQWKRNAHRLKLF